MSAPSDSSNCTTSSDSDSDSDSDTGPMRPRPGPSKRDARPGDNKKSEKKTYSGLRTARVLMPNGEKVSISVPTPSKCDCKRPAKTTMIPLNPKGKLGGREFKIVSDQMRATIRKHPVSFSKYEIHKIFKIQNCCLYNRYRNMQRELGKRTGYVTERMLFHGTPSYSDIIATGFDERHATIDGLFGAGIYFAEHSSKSNQYVFSAVKSNQLFAFLLGRNGCHQHGDASCYVCERRMLLCRVSLGKIFKTTTPKKMAHPPPGYNSVEGEPSPNGLKYPEYVIYRGEQAYPEYSISYRIVK